MSNLELYIAQLLTKEHYRFQQEKIYQDLKGGKFRFDFFLPDINGGVLCELDGQQHFHQVKKFQPQRRDFQKTQGHDRQKNEYALAHNIPLYRIPYWEIDNIKSVNDIFQDKFLVKSKYHNDDLIEPNY